MRLDPREEGRRWLEQAREDLRWAEDLAHRGGYHIACFLAQQVGEKALKAVLYGEGQELVLGHSIERLSREVSASDAALAPRARRWTILDGYYVAARYPNSLPESIPARVFTAEAARDAVALARDIVLYAGERLPS
jgi:HEPN domain-containing protein